MTRRPERRRIAVADLEFSNPRLAGRCKPEILESVRQRGIVNPLVVWPDNRVVVGNQRLTAARQLGIESIDCIVIWRRGDAPALKAEYDPIPEFD